MIGYRFLFPAEEEMTEASVFYEAASRGLGQDFLDDVQQAIDRVCEYPQAGEVIASDLRRVLLHRFPFSIIYSVETNLILVISIAHHARRPGYWQSRVDR
ncbi:MAG TPA: type II toxin-antitoxin system RelE/ParE family toxin [Pyrinomonadaceae bacterium]|nr:type II toxin-antitoxin system RelE/ParE family toxin [Pyrinomonadaceae bacterium]